MEVTSRVFSSPRNQYDEYHSFDILISLSKGKRVTSKFIISWVFPLGILFTVCLNNWTSVPYWGLNNGWRTIYFSEFLFRKTVHLVDRPILLSPDSWFTLLVLSPFWVGRWRFTPPRWHSGVLQGLLLPPPLFPFHYPPPAPLYVHPLVPLCPTKQNSRLSESTKVSTTNSEV